MKDKINAIYNEDLDSFLEKERELDKIEKGERFCMICGVPINLSNIQMVIPHKDKGFGYVCDSIVCVEKYYENKK
jgi:hypothetical protein